MIDSNPKIYGLKHDTWRSSQFDFLNKATSIIENGGGFIFSELPTGCGKTVIPTMLSTENKVLALVQTLGLLDQYEREYGFDIIKGKQEYPCMLQQKIRQWRLRYNKIPTVADCHFDNPRQCSVYGDCPYFQAKARAVASNRAACTYRYAALSDHMQNRNGILVLDEAHRSAEEMLALSEFIITQDNVDAYGLPNFPMDTFGPGGKGDILDIGTLGKILLWLLDCGLHVGRVDTLDLMTEEGARQKGFAKYIDRGIKMITHSDKDHPLFMYMGMRGDWENASFCLILKPLSVVDVARSVFANKQTVILMSATIGNPDPLATELGIENYQSFTYPHPVPSEYRPVYDLEFERMTMANIKENPALIRQQALSIARFIKQFDPNWRGIVLTTANYKIKEIREILSERLPGRIFFPSRKAQYSVSRRINEFLEDRRQGLISIDTIQGWGSGLDLRNETARFSVVAGVPYMNPSEKFDVLRSERPGGYRYSMWNTFNHVVQACGRVSRGEITDDGNYLLNVSALADGSCTIPQAMSLYPKWYKDAIVTP